MRVRRALLFLFFISVRFFEGCFCVSKRNIIIIMVYGAKHEAVEILVTTFPKSHTGGSFYFCER